MHPFLWLTFAVIMVGFLVVDLGYLNRKPHAISTKSALLQTLFWVAISVFYGGLIFHFLGSDPAAEFMSAYVTEKMLSVDNLFVIMVIFGFLKIEPKYQHRVLLWGILGAVVLRGAFIGVGAAAVHHFHWILYFFGAFLVYSGLKLLKGGDDDAVDLKDNKVMKFAERHLHVTRDTMGGKFFLTSNGEWFTTTLFVALLMVETMDIMFAVDSIPAVFSITQDPFIAFTSNMFAVMGLRALFFIVENAIKRFHHLQRGVSIVLIFIGAKMLMDMFDWHVSPILSLFIILGLLIGSLATSVLFPKKT